jgi:hypothetical protein
VDGGRVAEWVEPHCMGFFAVWAVVALSVHVLDTG